MDLLKLLIFAALVATIVVLASGLVSMSRGGTFDRAHSEQLMWGRIGLQGLAILLLLAALFVV